jgi:hypothetical protein
MLTLQLWPGPFGRGRYVRKWPIAGLLHRNNSDNRMLGNRRREVNPLRKSPINPLRPIAATRAARGRAVVNGAALAFSCERNVRRLRPSGFHPVSQTTTSRHRRSTNRGSCGQPRQGGVLRFATPPLKNGVTAPRFALPCSCRDEERPARFAHASGAGRTRNNGKQASKSPWPGGTPGQEMLAGRRLASLGRSIDRPATASTSNVMRSPYFSLGTRAPALPSL